MKIITCHLISFGKFQDVKFEFNNGLNIIHGLNESGKTTLYNFIYGMFYGFVRPYRKRTVFLDEYHQYQPLFSEQYEGQITFKKDGKEYILYRDFLNKSFDILDYLTGKSIVEELPDFSYNELDYPGNYFFEIPSDVFKNTITIDKNWTHISKSSVSSLSDYLMNSSQGGESLDIRDSLDYLMEEKNKIGQRRSTTKPYGILLNRLDTIEGQKDKYNEDVKNYKTSLKEKEKLKENIGLLENQLKRISEKKIYDQFFYLEKRFQEKEKIEKELKELEKELSHYDIIKNLSEDEVENILRIEKNQKGIEERLLYLTENKNDFYRNISYYREESLKAKDYEYHKKNLEQIHFYEERLIKIFKLLTVISGLFIFLSFFSYDRVSKSLFFIFSLLTLFSVLGVLISFYFRKRNESKITEIREILERDFHLARNIPLEYLLEDEKYEEDSKKYENEISRLEENLSLVDQEIADTIKKEQSLIDYKKNRLHLGEFFHENDNLTKILLDLEDLEEKIQDKKSIYHELSNEDYSLLKFELKNREMDWEEIDVSKKQDFEISLQKTKEELAGIEERLSILETSFHKMNLLEEEKTQLQAEKTILEENIEALDLAISEINKSRSHLQRNFIPRFNKKLTEIYQFIADSKDQILLDEDFNIRLSKNGEFLETSHISSGTQLLIVLLLKIQLIDEILSKDSLLIFDDAFLEIDDTRLLKVLLFLDELSYDYQILLFSNQLREVELSDSQNIKYHQINLGDSHDL